MKDIGKNIKAIRQTKGMTQNDLADALYVTRQTVSNYENGRSQPDLDMLLKIAEILESAELTIEELKEKALRAYFDGAKNDFRIRYIQSSIERLIANQIINLKIH